MIVLNKFLQIDSGQIADATTAYKNRKIIVIYLWITQQLELIMKPVSNLFHYIILVSFLMILGCNRSENDKSEYRTVAYIAGYRDFDFSTIEASKLTHINFAFANIIDGKVAFDTKPIDGKVLSSSDIESLVQLKDKNSDLKILVAVGGWTWSGGFSDAALTTETRMIFAESVAEFVKQNKLDGIDIDWEYPNQIGAGNTFRESDIENFTLLLKACRECLDKINPDYILTIASGADSAYINNTKLGEVAKYLDFINVMTYDFKNGLHTETGHHANLQQSGSDVPGGNSVLRAVQLHIDAGVPLSKINVGIPFYGRMWRGVNPERRGLYQEARTTGEIIYYRVIKEDVLSDTSFADFWDTSAAARWLWNRHDSIFISYEDTESIRQKIDYLKRKGLGGVMFWEYTDNPDGELLNSIDHYLNRADLLY